ncbi:MAG: hypothetical protein HZC51_08685 [Nitrospirae bacterium]|nr:hypothetical protein [Nitrospirota bacterium]
MNRFRLLILAGILLAAAAVAIGDRKNEDSPHAFTDSDCFYCHFTLPGSSGVKGEPLRFTDSITSLCARCHDMSGTVSHLVDFVPSREFRIPAGMPLDEEGRMTCVTCHDVHMPFRDPLGEKTHFLRRGLSGKALCLACHACEDDLNELCQEHVAQAGGRKPGEAGDITSHKPVMDRGHGFANYSVLDQKSELDALSLACLDCHNETGSPDGTTIRNAGWRHSNSGIGLSHPIGMDYYRATMEHEDMVSERDLDARLRLFDGKIGCCTCHDPYAPGDGASLVIGERDGYQDLCFGCHIK